jgi:hypothetical protein
MDPELPEWDVSEKRHHGQAFSHSKTRPEWPLSRGAD